MGPNSKRHKMARVVEDLIARLVAVERELMPVRTRLIQRVRTDDEVEDVAGLVRAKQELDAAREIAALLHERVREED